MILQFLRKLAARGQAVLCTIHQPSAALFAEFDQLLLLTKGGKVSEDYSFSIRKVRPKATQTVYFGGIQDLPGYFAQQDIDFPATANPAEYVIEVVSGCLSQGRDWHSVWVNSQQSRDRMQELEAIKKESGETPAADDNDYEYASTFGTQIKIVCERAFVQVSLYTALMMLLELTQHSSTEIRST